MAESFLPVLVLMVFAAGIAGVILLLSSLLGPRLRTARKLDTYESGVPLVDASRKRLSIRFFLVAMVFRSGGFALFTEMLVFLAILAVGYAYLWKKGAFDW